MFWCQGAHCPEHWIIQPQTYIRAKVHCMITMHARRRQTDEHHGNSATISSADASRAKNVKTRFMKKTTQER